MRNLNTLIFCIFLLIFPTASRTQVLENSKPPSWAKDAIWYQIFVERFSNGNQANDPTPANINTPPINSFAPAGWSITPWTSDWYTPEPWSKQSGQSFNVMLQHRRYGGDMQGVINKLNYLRDLGVNAIFLNPINDAPSLHKYDARNYHHVDVNFGPDPKGDSMIIASENPADPSTWKWTSADKLFLQLVQQAHDMGMKVIMDYSWNHTGTMFWAWQDVLKNQERSIYKDWYEIPAFDDPATTANEFQYKGWANVPSLPEIRKVNVKGTRISGIPYEGDISEPAAQHMFAVAARWLAPDGDTSKGIDGYRLDVADQIGLGFWRRFRKEVRQVKKETYLVGEIWWEKWPDQLMDPVPYTSGDVFDAVMFYQVYRPARYFFAKTNMPINAQQFTDSLQYQWNRLSRETRYAMMNVSSSHDAPRLLTCFNNPNKYKYQATPNDDKNYNTGKPSDETYRRLKMYLVHLFTSIGAPQIWNGEEMGMWGADDPDCRKPLWWPEYKFDKETRNNVQPGPKQYDEVGFNKSQFDLYKKLINIRKANPELVDGEIEFTEAMGERLAYKRMLNKQEVIVLFNAGSKKEKFVLPEHHVFVDLMSEKSGIKESVTLEPLSAMILKAKK